MAHTMASAGLKTGGEENRPNVIRQTMPPSNEEQEAGTSAYPLLTAMLLSQITCYYRR